MKYAPSISSIISPEYLAALVIKHYGFDSNTTCLILKIGINHSYLLVTPDQKFVLRVYSLDWRKESEINEELWLLDYLRENGILVSYPIKDCNNNYLNRVKAFEGERFAVLFSYADGESIRIPSATMSFNLGVTMAKMHQLTVDKTIKRKDYNSDTLVNWAFQLTKNHFTKPSNEMQYFERANSIIASEFERADLSSLRNGIVHFDLWYENIKIVNESEITIFDFDNCGNGWLFLDIAYSLMILFRNEPNKENFHKYHSTYCPAIM